MHAGVGAQGLVQGGCRGNWCRAGYPALGAQRAAQGGIKKQGAVQGGVRICGAVQGDRSARGVGGGGLVQCGVTGDSSDRGRPAHTNILTYSLLCSWHWLTAVASGGCAGSVLEVLLLQGHLMAAAAVVIETQ